MSVMRKLSLYGPAQRGPHVSYPYFLKAILKVSPSLGRRALRVVDEIFSGKYTQADSFHMDVEVESAFDEFHHLCKSHGISLTVGDFDPLD